MVLNEKALKDDIDTYLRTYAITYCKQAEKEAVQMAKLAIEQFYEDYTPKYYDRTFDLLNNSYIPYYHDNGKAIYGGVRICSDNMSDYANSWGSRGTTSAENVASWTWKAGYHGYKNGDINQGIYTFPPLVMLEIAMGEQGFQNRLMNNAFNMAKKQKYNYLDALW